MRIKKLGKCFTPKVHMLTSNKNDMEERGII